MKRHSVQFGLVAITLLAVLLISCGGGGNAGTGGSGSALIAITTDAILPAGLANAPYSTTLQASNGSGALTWSIAPSGPTSSFVNGLSINPGTGVLSGTANFEGTSGFLATVQDSASHSATKAFYLTAYPPLQTPAPQTFSFSQYEPISFQQIPINGGLPPLSITVSGSPLPVGVTLDRETGIFRGSPMATGSFYTTVTIRDSYAPAPEVVSVQIGIQVAPPPFSIANSLPPKLILNRPFSGRVVALGGIPPYNFVMTSGSLPPGISAVDTATGQVSGTPTLPGFYSFTVSAADSSSPPLSASVNFGVNVAAPIGRNDTIATATTIDNGNFSASISPYIDPPDAAPQPADSDYYKLTSISGATVHLETSTQQFLDTVIEILDVNGTRLATCNQPGNTNTNFASACINDDIPDPPTTDSALDFKVPGSPSTTTTFFVHVLDWRGDARPDMLYGLSISGVVDPLKITSTSLTPAARGLSYSQQLTSANGTGTINWSLSSGTLPPGITMNSSGVLTGPATTDGTYSFTVQAGDSSTPPQVATADEQIQVGDPVKIVGSGTLPAACVNQPYTFAMQSSGGVQPFFWGFSSNNWMGINFNNSTGVFSGMSSNTGTFTGRVGLGDATGHSVTQNISITVNQCP
jgi:large repetitive protein